MPGVAVVRGLLSWCVVMLLTMVEGSRCKCPQEWLASMLAYKSGNSLAGKNSKCTLFSSYCPPHDHHYWRDATMMMVMMTMVSVKDFIDDINCITQMDKKNY